MKKPTNIGILAALHTGEVSSVDRAANKRKWAILKSEGQNQMKLLKSVLDVEVQAEEVVSKFEGVSEQGNEALRGLARIVSGFADELSAEHLAETLKAAGVELPVAEAAEEKKEEEVTVTKMAELPEDVQALFKAQEAHTAKLTAKLDAVTKALADAEEEKEKIHFSELAKSYSDVGEEALVASVLKSLKGHEASEGVETLLRGAQEKIEKSKLLETVATPEAPEVLSVSKGQSAIDAVEEIMKSESDKGTGRGQAMLSIMKNKPELYKAYEAALYNEED